MAAEAQEKSRMTFEVIKIHRPRLVRIQPIVIDRQSNNIIIRIKQLSLAIK